MFRYLLIRTGGKPYDPVTWETAVPNWSVGETIMLGEGEQLRILDIQTEIADVLVDHGFTGVFTVEPVD
jgi:hypothetical protein